MLHFEELTAICGGNILHHSVENTITHLLTDSRKAHRFSESLFFAVSGERHDGHDYLQFLYKEGVKQFVVEKAVEIPDFKGNMIVVDNCIDALQKIAGHHRAQFDIPVVGITGSNGKTIVKEWLFAMLSPFINVVRSPKSYNSQLGVPLSLWEINSKHELGIFEAGISQPDEMQKLESIIKPSIGILTNIGTAHDEGFESRQEKLQEKLKLFSHCDSIIYCKDHQLKSLELVNKGFSWGSTDDCNFQVTSLISRDGTSLLDAAMDSQKYRLIIPFADQSSLENTLHCVAFMASQGYEEDRIQAGINRLQKVNMRLALKKGINQCYLIDDSYNNDLAGLQMAVDFLTNQKQRVKKTIILSDIPQSGLLPDALYKKAGEIIDQAHIDKFIGIGPKMEKHKAYFNDDASFYSSTEDFLKHHDNSQFSQEVVLIKGARAFTFENIVKRLEEQVHGTLLEINLDSLTANLNFYRSQLQRGTKLMVMVKAFAYGSGGLEVANLLQYHQVDYLGVAYTDEGVALRKGGIRLPVMVMNPSVDTFEKLTLFDLEPEIYSFRILEQYIQYLKGSKAGVHIKLDTGMRRLGFALDEMGKLKEVLDKHPNIEVRSIFSHLAGADESTHNEYSIQQATTFDTMSNKLTTDLTQKPIRHLLNSAGILRFPEYHLDMVRLGIGLYGLEANNKQQDQLQTISTLKTIISQIKEIKKGETIGYGRKGHATEDMTIATIAIGYADGFSRAFSNGVGKVCVKGSHVPVVGNVCMDMTMIDVTGLEVMEGDEVEIFGRNISISELAQNINTIPYEILTNVSQRVKRVFYTE